MSDQPISKLFSCNKPCGNCPYRTDAPLQLWHKSEYEKLLLKEQEYLGSLYLCHKKNGSICIGWLIKQVENDLPSIHLRIELTRNSIQRAYIEGLKSPAPLYETVYDMIKANYPQLSSK